MVISPELVTVGQVERPFGIKGEVKVRSLSDVPGRLESLGAVSLVTQSGQTMETRVTQVRLTGKGFFIMGLADVTTPEAAEAWRGGFIQIPRGTAPALPEGNYYACDLIGLEVRTDQGKIIGTLDRIWDVPCNPVFVVQNGSEEILIPAVKEWVSAIDLVQRRMIVHLLDGAGNEHPSD